MNVICSSGSWVLGFQLWVFDCLISDIVLHDNTVELHSFLQDKLILLALEYYKQLHITSESVSENQAYECLQQLDR